ncbi:hypothetical protein DSO57_1016608 [Entomophthora muscae]|uniref:Uncharacterized protein n=1 Tax=Entomophthora muscae TaxID=34485 RepID=A0ACC2SHQ6_9FUNG|nr:hypothetical protein DSO57_1016608 [Entomophthora muscae]
MSTSSNYQKATDVNKQQKPAEQTRKKPKILLCKPVAPITKKEKEKEKPSNQQDSTEVTPLSIWKEVSAFKKLVNGRTSKKKTEALNPSTVEPIPEDTNMGYTVPMDFENNIAWLESSWKELFEAFKSGGTRENLGNLLPVALNWAFPGKYHVAPQAISLQNIVGKRCPAEYQELFFITLFQEANFLYFQLMGFLYLLTLEMLFEVTHEKDFSAKEIPDVTKLQLTEFLNSWLANGPQSEFLASLKLLIFGLFGSYFGVARLDQVEFPDFLSFCKVGSSCTLEANVVGKAVLVMYHLQDVLYSLGFVVSLK